MRCLNLLFAAALIVFGSVVLTANIGRAQISQAEQLRQQIKSAQKQLEQLEQTIENKDRATQVGSAQRQNDGTTMIVRLYDLGDLFAIAPDYFAQIHSELGKNTTSLFPSNDDSGLSGGGFGGGAGGSGGAGFNVNSQSAFGAARTSMDGLIDAITSTISPTKWDEVGGASSIVALGNALLISTDVHTHQQIDNLLDLFRKRWGTLRTVSVCSRWLWLNDAELSELLAKPAGAAGKNGGKVKAYGLVDEKRWTQHLLKIADPKSKTPAGYRAQLTCYNGQTVHTLSGEQRLAVTGMTPVVGGENVGYRPVVSVIQQGAALQVTPVVTTGGKTVILDIHSRVCELKEPAAANSPAIKKTAYANPSDATLAVVAALDRSRLMIHRLSTTIRLPADRVMLVGGMTYGKAKVSGERSLYLFVKLSVQELRDDPPARDKEKKNPNPATYRIPGKAPATGK